MSEHQSIQLLNEVERNNTKGVKKALQNGANINFIQKPCGDFALKLAAKSDKYYVVAKLLIEQGVFIDLVDDKKNSALMVACKNGSVKIASLLLDKGARVDLRDSNGNSALMSLCADTLMPKSTFTKLATALLHSHGDNEYSESELLIVACAEGNYTAAEFLIQHGVYRDSAGLSALISACRHGRTKLVELLLKSLTNVNLQNKEGTTALMITSKYGQTASVELLLKSSAKLDLQDVRKRTALMLACENGQIRNASLLLAKGARVDMQDNKGRTVLMSLCADSQPNSKIAYRLMELLLEYGASVNEQNNIGTSALMFACWEGNERIAQLLLNHGAKVDLQDKKGRTALMTTDKLNILELLLQNGANVNIQDHAGQSVIMHHHNPKVLEFLLDRGAQLDLRDINGRTALIAACFKSNKQCVNLIIQHKSKNNIDVQDNTGVSALMKACENDAVKFGWLDMVQKFIKQGASVDSQDNEGRTALMRMCQHGKSAIGCIELLLKGGAQVNVQDDSGMSALMIACSSRKFSPIIIQILLENKANVNLQDHLGQTVLMIACERGLPKVTKSLLETGASVNVQNLGKSALKIACRKCSLEVAQLLVNSGADIDQQDSTGQSALMIAACTGIKNSPAITRLLLENGANVNLQNVCGMTALDHVLEAQNSVLHSDFDHEYIEVDRKKNILATVADLLKQHGASNSQVQELPSLRLVLKRSFLMIQASENGDKDAVKLSLGDGAEVDSRDSKGRTALIAASENGHSAIADLLIKGGACVDLQDNEGRSALMAACQNGHVQIASNLLEKGADTFSKDSKGMTALDIVVEKNVRDMLSSFAKLRSNPNYPGIVFSEGAKREIVGTEHKIIDLKEVGISLSIPKDALSSTDPLLELEIRPCFSGPFEAPQGVELVSPAYIVKPSRKVSFKKEVLVKIWHHADVESEKDCEDMAFLSASITPEFRGDSPVYFFREIRGAKGLFRPGKEQPVGEIALKHFCTLTLGKRKREGDKTESEENVSKRNKAGNLYSARLYRTIEKKLVFCVCLFQPQYIKNCNMVIAAKYGTPGKKIDPSECFNGVRITSSEVNLRQTCDSGWTAMFKKRPASILKEEINTQELYDISDLLEMDYPPKIEIAIQSAPGSPDAGPLCLHVEGLDRESIFVLHPRHIFGLMLPSTLGLDTSTIQCAMSDLREELQEQDQFQNPTPVATLLPTASEMLSIMETVEQLLQHIHSNTESVMSLLIKLERKSEKLKRDTIQILKDMKLSYDINIYVERANTIAVQMKGVFKANMTHCHSPEWQSAVGLFVTNAANLMTAIKDTLRAAKCALTLHNNYTPSVPSPPVAAQLSPILDSAVTQPHPKPRPRCPRVLTQLTPTLASAVTQPHPKPRPRRSRVLTQLTPILASAVTQPHPKPRPRRSRVLTQPQQDPKPPPIPFKPSLAVDPTSPPELPHTLRLPSAQSLQPPKPHALPRCPRCPRGLTQHPNSPSQPLSTPSQPLTKDYTAAVCRCLYPLRAKWKTIGTFLCVDHDSLEAIKAGNEQLDDRLTALIAVWLRRHTPPPTWQALADAVHYVDPEKAQKIRTEMGQ